MIWFFGCKMSRPPLPPRRGSPPARPPPLVHGRDDVEEEEVASQLTNDPASVVASGVSKEDVKTEWLEPLAKSQELYNLFPRSKYASTGSVKAAVWQFYMVVGSVKEDADPDELPSKEFNKSVYACCNSCGALVVCGNWAGNGKPKEWHNSGLSKHLGSAQHTTSVEILESKLGRNVGSKRSYSQLSIASSFSAAIAKGAKVQIPAKDKPKVQEVMTTKFITDMLLPLSIVESQSFRDMIHSHNPNARVMSNKKVKTIVCNLEEQMRDVTIKATDGEDVSLTLDHWTSKGHDNYTGMTCHFIDKKWKLHSLPLGICLQEGRTRSAELDLELVRLWYNKLKMGAAKIFAITTDTTANMNSFGIMLEGKGIHHIYCTDHVLQLTCRMCYDDPADAFGEAFADSVDKARKIVKFFSQSTQAAAKLKQKQIEHHGAGYRAKGVVTDVVTRWWSTYAMFQRLLLLRPFINAMALNNELKDCEPLTPVDWDNIQGIQEVLKPFKSAQLFLEGEHYVTASCVAESIKKITGKLVSLSSAPHETASKRLAINLKEDFVKRWKAGDEAAFTGTVERGDLNRQVGIHPVLLIATFLDPRFKSLFSISHEPSKKAIEDKVLELMKNLHGPEAAASEVATAAEAPADPEEDEDSDDDDIFWSLNAEATAAQEGMEGVELLTVEAICANELKRYKMAQGVEPLNRATKKLNDPLPWWKKNAPIFPTLAKLARKYLAVQATSAPSERVFSVASRLISSKRARLGSEMAGKILFVSENWKSFEEKLDLQAAAASDNEEEE